MALKIESVLILDGVDKICASKLTVAGIKVTAKGKLAKEELIEEVQAYDALVVRSATKVTEEVLNGACRLKVIGRAGTGVDNIDVKAATKKGILVINAPGGNTLSAAEHTCALICALSRSIPQACMALKGELWDRKKFMGNELYQKTLGIVGLGRIGTEVARRMQSFGMKTIGFDPIVSKESAESMGIEYLSLKEIWPRADYITVHTPLIPATRNLIGVEALKACKPSVKIVNVARGGIVDEKALLDALENGTCGGAALDVFEQEPPKEFSLAKHPKAIVTPHLGANTVEAQKRVAEEIADQFLEIVAGNSCMGIVNAPGFSMAGRAEALPWINLAQSVGILGSQMVSRVTGPLKITVELYGEEACKFSKVIPLAIQKGILLEQNICGVNLISAPTIAKEKLIEIKTVECASKQLEGPKAANAIAATFTRGSTNAHVSGYNSSGQPILYELDNSRWKCGLSLEGHLTFLKSTSSAALFREVAAVLEQSSILALLTSSDGKTVALRSSNGIRIPPVATLIAQAKF